jgi:hypothetical protein
LKEKSALGQEAGSRSTAKDARDLQAEEKNASSPETNSNLSESNGQNRPAGERILDPGGMVGCHQPGNFGRIPGFSAVFPANYLRDGFIAGSSWFF